MDDKQLAGLAANLVPGGSFLRGWRLLGGLSAQTTAIEICLPDKGVKRLVIRQHGEADLRQNPQIFITEYRLLTLLHSLGLPVPKPYRVLPAGEYLNSPGVVVEYVPGQTELTPVDALPLAEQMADGLLRIHAVDITELDFLPQQTEEIVCKRPTLLHGDYWPGNILWQEGQLAAIIDWEDALLGDPLSDLANSRLELALVYGSAAVHVFTERYRNSSYEIDYTTLPHWDLWAASRLEKKIPAWRLDKQTERTMLNSIESFKKHAQLQL